MIGRSASFSEIVLCNLTLLGLDFRSQYCPPLAYGTNTVVHHWFWLFGTFTGLNYTLRLFYSLASQNGCVFNITRYLCILTMYLNLLKLRQSDKKPQFTPKCEVPYIKINPIRERNPENTCFNASSKIRLWKSLCQKITCN